MESIEGGSGSQRVPLGALFRPSGYGPSNGVGRVANAAHGGTEDIDKYIEYTRDLLDARRVLKDNPNAHIWGRRANDLAGPLGLQEPYCAQEWRDYWHINFVFGGKDVEVEDRLQACIHEAEAQRKAQASSLIEKGDEDTLPTLRNLKNPVPCGDVGLIVHKRSDNIARALESRRYAIVRDGGKCYCDAEDAALLWPKWKKHWREKKRSEEF